MSKVSESTGAEDRTGTLPRPDAGSLIARSAAQPWEPDGSSGFSYKTLFEDPSSGQTTMLMKVEAGALSPSHMHDQLEQVFVIDGTFYDEYRNYEAGDFIVRAPGALHTGGSRDGALLLVVYSA
ncbi:MAG: cupin domain-containing protein [Rhodospirillales bacterium]